ncbi:glycerophosphoryl diester phosphodiesterase membrane domain-containing protein [Modicisalibacter tunisiensis]|uniref:glycerophosphodiester phosphodiesterase n=1 Tax=Modicisalibacter tunisiensis TaxID=390637 RepID=UPI001CCF0674|nr:glycerophosphodiester phosphodiesterase family protein [Modicisalibacter tunisiensis]MBZ9538354.1 glycerophosphoryl diester phosphodiesterase membrane domain-containing protein [Modicisalibacter tunisiensis]
MPESPATTLAPHALGVAALRSLREHWRPLVAYQLFFTLLSATLLLPASASTLAALLRELGRPPLTGAQLLDVALTPWGALWLLTAIALSALLLALQQAGMLLVVARPGAHRYRQALEALWNVGRRLPGIAGLTLLQTTAQLAVALVPLLLLEGLYRWLLGDMESYVVMQTRPAALGWFLLAAVAPLALWLWAAAALYLRWVLALPALVLEGRRVGDALRRSRTLTRGHGRRLLLPVILPVPLVVLLPLGASLVFDTLVTPLLGWLPERTTWLIPAMLAYLTFYGLLALAATFIGVAVNSLVTGCLYLRLAHRQPRPPSPTRRDHPAWVAWGAEALVLLVAAGQAFTELNRFTLQDTVTITAHRGSSIEAPENTLAAFERAIADGADYIEFDARLSADGQVVISHDDSLRRLLGRDERISELAWPALREIDVGSWFGPAYRGEHIPRLESVLRLTRNRIRLYIELKPTGDNATALVDAVLARLPRERRDQVVIASLSPAVIREVERRAPQLHTTLFAQFMVRGGLALGDIDALGLRHARIDAATVAATHGRGYALHAWTVNDRRQMARLIDLGVDNIITDRPAQLAELLAERATLSDGELLLLKLRSWLHA